MPTPHLGGRLKSATASSKDHASARRRTPREAMPIAMSVQAGMPVPAPSSSLRRSRGYRRREERFCPQPTSPLSKALPADSLSTSWRRAPQEALTAMMAKTLAVLASREEGTCLSRHDPTWSRWRRFRQPGDAWRDGSSLSPVGRCDHSGKSA